MRYLRPPETCIVICCLLLLARGDPIELVDHGYRNVIIAIHPSIAEDEQLISRIQDMFTEASEYLFHATGGRVYYENITIAVPETWTYRPDYTLVKKNYFQEAHVRIDQQNPSYGDTPYTLQPEGCGEEGTYIHLTPNYTLGTYGSDRCTNTSAGKQLVHEWAHLRYGVFDEHGYPGDTMYPVVYRDNGTLHPTSCGNKIEGCSQTRAGDSCTVSHVDGVDKDCFFIPDEENDSQHASLMFDPNLGDSFCGSTDGVPHRHNDKAPSKQNVLCEYESTWDVISRHLDIANNEPTTRSSTRPKFHFVMRKKESPRYMLLLDSSGSMNGTAMQLLREGSSRFIQDTVPEGSTLGIVEFNTDSTILANRTVVNKDTRNELVEKLPKQANGATAIGKGLLTALEAIEMNGGNAEGALIILVTDGEENIPPFIEDVLPDLIQRKVIVNCIALGRYASDKLEELAGKTGGKAYLIQEVTGNTAVSGLDSALQDSVSSQMDEESQMVQVVQEDWSVTPPSSTRNVYLSHNSVFALSGVNITDVEMEVVTPSGKVYDSTSDPYYSRDEYAKRIQIKIPEADFEPGQYAVRVYTTWTKKFSLSVTFFARNYTDQPIRARSWLNATRSEGTTPLKIHTEVKKDYYAILKASVRATVSRPEGGDFEIVLRDNGVGADTSRDDGIYSAYISQFTQDGRYSAICRTTNQESSTVYSGSGISPKSIFKPDNDFIIIERKSEPTHKDRSTATNTPMKTMPVENFERVSAAGSFFVEGDPPNHDLTPPHRINDLRVVAIKTSERNESEVTLRWTSPGDDLDFGKASDVDLRAAPSYEDLRYNFDSAYRYTGSLVEEGDLTPLPPGEEQEITVVVLSHVMSEDGHKRRDVYFAVKVVDEVGNAGETSVITSAHFYT